MSIDDRVNEILGRLNPDEPDSPPEPRPLADNPQLYGDIVDDLRAGVAYNVIQKKRKVSRGVIADIARREDLQRFSPNTQSATAARGSYTRDRRIELLDKAFMRLEQLLDEVTEPGELQKLAQVIGTLIEKRRLEDGDVTNRTESILAGAKERLEARVALMGGRIARAAEPPPELPPEPSPN